MSRAVWEVDLRESLDDDAIVATEKVVASTAGRATAKAQEFHEPRELVATRVQMTSVLSS